MRERGFTLVELLVALTIFGMLAAAGVALLSFSVTAQAASGEKLAAIASVRRVSAVLTSDLAQALPRIARDESGERQPAFIGNDGSDELLMGFVRGGWSNLDEQPRSTLQKIEYRLIDGRLERRAFPMVDGTTPDDPAVLVEQVESLALRYRADEEWRERWDPLKPELMPHAVEMVVTRRGEAPLRHVLLVGGAS